MNPDSTMEITLGRKKIVRNRLRSGRNVSSTSASTSEMTFTRSVRRIAYLNVFHRAPQKSGS
ncbi:hypothetical protein D3C75_1140840 [compost metagenome]